jgi:hypothetical protein
MPRPRKAGAEASGASEHRGRRRGDRKDENGRTASEDGKGTFAPAFRFRGDGRALGTLREGLAAASNDSVPEQSRTL